MYRTRTYLAGDWDGDSNLIQKIIEWNEKDYWSLSFTDAHKLKQARDGSLNCNIKRSLSDRLGGSKTFVLIVGEHTDKVTQGSCQHCHAYSKYSIECSHNMKYDLRSYIEYECEIAERDYRLHGVKIVVIYNYLTIHKDKCPEVLRNIGKHVAGLYRDSAGNIRQNYQEIKDAIMQ